MLSAPKWKTKSANSKQWAFGKVGDCRREPAVFGRLGARFMVLREPIFPGKLQNMLACVNRWRGMVAARLLFAWFLVASAWCGPSAHAQELFSELVGPIGVQPVSKSTTVSVPYILWGGDIATFMANGDLKTKRGSIYQTSGLDIELKPGDDFVGQVRDYMSGKSPFLRGTMHMIGLAGETLAADPRTKPSRNATKRGTGISPGPECACPRSPLPGTV